MARHDDRDRVRAECLTGGPHRVRASGLRRDAGVAAHFAEGNRGGRPQDAALEVGERREVYRHVEAAALAREVLIELPRDRVGPARVRQDAGPVCPHDPRELVARRLSAVVDREHALRTDRHPERAER